MSASLFTLRTFTLALIDDDPIYQLILNRLLKGCQQRCRSQYFANGPEALAYLKRNHLDPASTPDAILLDLNLPMLKGWDVLTEIEKIPFSQRPKVYILSSSIDPEDKHRAQKHPAVSGFLPKPLYLEDLKGLLQKAA
ncbi:MAG: response regulator [Bacteroidia bacterium]